MLPVGVTIDSGLARNSIQTLVESPEQLASPASISDAVPAVADAADQPVSNGMEDYQRLKQELLLTIAILTLPLFGLTWLGFGLNIALNYLLGAVVSLMYMRMLAQAVEKLGNENRKLNPNRLGLFALVIILATRVPQLQVLPIFLGFLTYKAALLVYTLRVAVFSKDSAS
jgi:ATP synthase protein I